MLDDNEAIYQALPNRSGIDADGMLLNALSVVSLTSVELAKVNLPSSTRLSPSVLLGVDGLSARVDDASKLVRAMTAAAGLAE